MEKQSSPLTIFISYSNTARQTMLLFRKHLEGLLFRRSRIWTDQSIPRGEKWESSLLSHLKQADAALLLVTPHYLASKWCRRELQHIAAMAASGEMKRVFWVPIEPSGWRLTELASFQALGTDAGLALSELNDTNARARAIATICEEIASEVLALRPQLDNDLLFVRRVIEELGPGAGVVVDSSITEGRGVFATVCRGRKGEAEVAVKVIRHSLIRNLAAKFEETIKGRKRLTNQCFIKVLDHFSVNLEHEQYSVVIEEMVRNDAKPLSRHLETERCQIDEVATAVRRAAEALKQFHETMGDTSYGLITSKRMYYDKRSGLLLMPAFGVSNFLWKHLGWERFSAWQEGSPNDAVYVSPEEVQHQKDTALTDQYRLGKIAFEMLEGKLALKNKAPSTAKEPWQLSVRPETS